MRLVRTSAAAAAIAMALAPLSAWAAESTYLRLGDIKGASADKKHKDWINVAHVSYAGGAVTLEVADGKASPALARAASTGQQFDKAVLETTDARGKVIDTETFDDVTLSGFKAGGETQQAQTLTLNYLRRGTAGAEAFGPRSSQPRPPSVARTVRPTAHSF